MNTCPPADQEKKVLTIMVNNPPGQINNNIQEEKRDRKI